MGMSNRDPRAATGTQPAEPTAVHAEDQSQAVYARQADERVKRFVDALHPDGTREERAAAVRLLLDMLRSQHERDGYPETTERGRAMNRRILGSALDLGVLTAADLAWSEEHFADVAVLRPRRRRPDFAPMGLRCTLVVEGDSAVVAVVYGRSPEEDQVVYAPLDEYAVERPS